MDTDDTASAPGADDSAINRLLAILKEDDESASPARAYGAAHALTQLGEPGIAALALVVQDWGAYGVWALDATIQALGESGDTRAIGLLQDIMRFPPRGGSMGEAARAGAALARLGAPGAGALADMAQEMDPATRQAAISIMGEGDTSAATTDIAPLLAALGDRGDPLTAAYAAGSLGKLRAVEAIPALIALLGEEEFEFLGNAAQGALFNMGEMAFPALIQALSSPSAVARQHAAWALCWQAADELARTGLLVALDDEDAEVRAAPICALRDHGGPADIPTLERIREQDEGVSMELGFLSDLAGEAIHTIEARAAGPEGHAPDEDEILAIDDALLGDETAYLEDVPLFEVVEMSAANSEREIARLMTEFDAPVGDSENEDGEPYYGAAFALAQLGPQGLAALAAVARDNNRDADVRVAAIDALACTGDEEATLATLLDVLHTSTGSWLRDKIQSALGYLGSPAAVPDLIAALDDGQWYSSAAASALVRIGEASMPALVAALSDRRQPDARRRGAAQALRELAGKQEAVTALFAALSDPDPEVRRLAVEGIALPDSDELHFDRNSPESSDQLREDPEAARALLPLLDDPDERVRAATCDALRKVGGLDDATLLERAARFASSVVGGANALSSVSDDLRAEVVGHLRWLAGMADGGNYWLMTWRAAHALGRLGLEGLAALDAALHDANLYPRLSRIWVIDALGASQDARAIPPLLDALHGVIADTPDEGRFAEELRAAYALARIGAPGRAVLVEVAQEAGATERERTRWAAREVLDDPPVFLH